MDPEEPPGTAMSVSADKEAQQAFIDVQQYADFQETLSRRMGHDLAAETSHYGDVGGDTLQLLEDEYLDLRMSERRVGNSDGGQHGPSKMAQKQARRLRRHNNQDKGRLSSVRTGRSSRYPKARHNRAMGGAVGESREVKVESAEDAQNERSTEPRHSEMDGAPQVRRNIAMVMS